MVKLRLVGGPVKAGTKCEKEVDGSWPFETLLFAFEEAVGSPLQGFNLHTTTVEDKKVKAGPVIKLEATPDSLGLKNNSILMIKKAGAGSNPATPRDAASPPAAKPAAKTAAASPPAGGKKQKTYKERVTAIYAKYQPDKLATVDKTLAKFKGQEEEVMKTLISKYGPEPVSDDEKEAPPPASPKTPVAAMASNPPPPATPKGDATPSQTPRTPGGGEGQTPRGGLSYRERVIAIYQKYDPGKVGQTDALLKKHAGKEKSVINSLVKKYGPEPEPPEETPRSEPASPASPKAAESAPPVAAAAGGGGAQVPPLQITPKRTYRDRLIAIYEKYEPSKVGQVDNLLKKFQGQEEKVINQLVKKYGPEPAPPGGDAAAGGAAASDSARGGVTSGGATPSTASGPRTYRERIIALYQKYDPSKVGQVDALLKKHEGKEKSVLNSLVKKYGPEPEAPAPAPVAAAPAPAAPTPPKPATPREEKAPTPKVATPREEPAPAAVAEPAPVAEQEAAPPAAEPSGTTEVVMTPAETPRGEEETPQTPVSSPSGPGAMPMEKLESSGGDAPPAAAVVVAPEAAGPQPAAQVVVKSKNRTALMTLAMEKLSTKLDQPLVQDYFVAWLDFTDQQAAAKAMQESVKSGAWEEVEGQEGKFRLVGSEDTTGVSLVEEFKKRRKNRNQALAPEIDGKVRTSRQVLSTVNPKFKTFPQGAVLEDAELGQVLDENRNVIGTLAVQVKQQQQSLDKQQEDVSKIQKEREAEIEEISKERREMAEVQSQFKAKEKEIDSLKYDTEDLKAQVQLSEEKHHKARKEMKEISAELEAERAGVPTDLEQQLAAKDETIAKLHQQLAKMRMDMRKLKRQQEDAEVAHEKEIKKIALKERAKSRSQSMSMSRGGNGYGEPPSYFNATFSSRQKYPGGSHSPSRSATRDYYGTQPEDEEFLPEEMNDTLENDRRLAIEENNENNRGEGEGEEEEDFNDDEVNLEPGPDRGVCPNCGAPHLVPFCNDPLEEMLEDDKAAFCFSCRSSFTAKDLRIRDRKNAKRDQILAKHAGKV